MRTRTMSGLDVITKYPIDKEIDIPDIWGNGTKKGPRWAKRMCMGSGWGIYNIGEEQVLRGSKKPVLTFVREVMILILDQFLDPWGRPFKDKGKKVANITDIDNPKFSAVEYQFFTTVEGMNIQCGVIVNPGVLFEGGCIIKHKDSWSWKYPVVKNTDVNYQKLATV